MKILIFRHGPAEPGGDGLADADRALTPDGAAKTRLAVQGLARIIERPDAILSSPKRRAQQTAGILGDVFDLPVETADALGRDELQPIETCLQARGEPAVAIVGHEPTLSRLAGKFLGIPPRAGHIEINKAAAVVMHVACPPRDQTEPSRLDLLLPSRVLRMLAAPARD